VASRTILASGRLIHGKSEVAEASEPQNPGRVFISATLALAICAQAPRRLQVEVGPNQQVSILARDVSYGEVLQAFERKLGWEIEIPALADELKLPMRAWKLHNLKLL